MKFRLEFAEEIFVNSANFKVENMVEIMVKKLLIEVFFVNSYPKHAVDDVDLYFEFFFQFL